ncbi:MAG TPA: amidohydrolase [Terriglobia bacterium]|nr:amidohydrolase [Terriglobia bacterium]
MISLHTIDKQIGKTEIVLMIIMIAQTWGCSRKEPADLIFTNCTVYTVNESQPLAEDVAIKKGRILWAGPKRETMDYVGRMTRVLDLRGSVVFPGFTDSHYHLSGVGGRELNLNLEGTANLEEFLLRIKQRVNNTREGEWITGRGWIETFWRPPVFPSRKDLDKVAPRNPVCVTRADGHATVVNSLTLRMAGINATTPNPSGGEIMKDPKTGQPTGMLLDSAMDLVNGHIPERESNDLEKKLLLGAERSIQLGWTEIQNAGSPQTEVDLIRDLYTRNRIKLRIYQAISGPGPDAQQLINEGATMGAFDGRFTLRTIKIFADGALGSKGAALLEPYSDYNSTGLMTINQDELKPMLEEALRRGIQVETHAIGDRANRVILDLYEEAFSRVPIDQRKVAEPRWRVEHAQIVHPEDLPRFFKLGVIPSMQPSHAISDLHFAPSRLGLKRLQEAYAWQSFLRSGSTIAGGSDAPVERGDPIIEFYAAVARRDLKGFSGEGWHPEQAVSREQALRMFTLWAAYAAFEEGSRGSIEPGKLADFTVLSADIMKIPVSEIPRARCVMTVIGGEVVYDAAGYSSVKN